MANIASQEKRIHRAERERLENRRRTSQVKTWFEKIHSETCQDK
jgi:small subunit ribosomal protein S20